MNKQVLFQGWLGYSSVRYNRLFDLAFCAPLLLPVRYQLCVISFRCATLKGLVMHLRDSNCGSEGEEAGIDFAVIGPVHSS